MLRRRWFAAWGRWGLGAVLGRIVRPAVADETAQAHPAPDSRALDSHAIDSSGDSIAGWAARRIERWRRPPLAGGFVGASFERGHRLRGSDLPRPSEQQRTGVAIVGTGIAGLAVARALGRAGYDDYRLFELEDEAGGNSRGGMLAGMACPWGAHYLPVPDRDNAPLRELVTELGIARPDGTRLVYDERMLCHAPQERLLIDGQWRSGLLPQPPASSAAQAELNRFADFVRRLRRQRLFALPADARAVLRDAGLRELERQRFDQWLHAQSYRSAELLWYLDYCCRDDYGAGIAEVSAWAGLHYFASRHGFFDDAQALAGERERALAENEEFSEVLTWPQGNGWLAERLAAPHRSRLVTGALAIRARDDGIDVMRTGSGTAERWRADRVVLAVPLFVAARLLGDSRAADGLRPLLPKLRYASWRVANVRLDRVPEERPGAPRSWDNVVHGDLSDGWLGYVDAMHQSLRSHPGPTVLTCYHAFGSSDEARHRLLERGWRGQADEVLSHLERAHPDIRDCASEVRIMRWGHAMLVPTPGLRSDPSLARLREAAGPVRFAHADLAGYSVFEEAFAIGHATGSALAAEFGVQGRRTRITAR